MFLYCQVCKNSIGNQKTNYRLCLKDSMIISTRFIQHLNRSELCNKWFSPSILVFTVIPIISTIFVLIFANYYISFLDECPPCMNFVRISCYCSLIMLELKCRYKCVEFCWILCESRLRSCTGSVSRTNFFIYAAALIIFLPSSVYILCLYYDICTLLIDDDQFLAEVCITIIIRNLKFHFA